jgi:hypothetical protein
MIEFGKTLPNTSASITNSAAVDGRSVLRTAVASLVDSHCGAWQHCSQLTCMRGATRVRCFLRVRPLLTRI